MKAVTVEPETSVPTSSEWWEENSRSRPRALRAPLREEAP